MPTPDKSSMIHGLKDACSDDALWLVSSIVDYIKETGDFAFADMPMPYADKGMDTVYEHVKTILNFRRAWWASTAYAWACAPIGTIV